MTALRGLCFKTVRLLKAPVTEMIRQVMVDGKDDDDALAHLHGHPEVHPQLEACSVQQVVAAADQKDTRPCPQR